MEDCGKKVDRLYCEFRMTNYKGYAHVRFCGCRVWEWCKAVAGKWMQIGELIG